jgi:hypothetical protein
VENALFCARNVHCCQNPYSAKETHKNDPSLPLGKSGLRFSGPARKKTCERGLYRH